MLNALQRLQFLCDTIPAKLAAIPEEEFSSKPATHKWSKKEIIGHLVDSAANNHQRFIRICYEDSPRIVYAQDDWVKHSNYQLMSSTHIINFWAFYNKHLVEVVSRIPTEYLARTGRTNEENPLTLQWLFEDYVVHMEHHLKEVLPQEYL